MRLGSGLALLLGACLLAQMAFLIVLAPESLCRVTGPDRLFTCLAVGDSFAILPDLDLLACAIE